MNHPAAHKSHPSSSRRLCHPAGNAPKEAPSIAQGKDRLIPNTKPLERSSQAGPAQPYVSFAPAEWKSPPF